MTDDKKTIDDRLTRNLTPLLRIGSVWVNMERRRLCVSEQT